MDPLRPCMGPLRLTKSFLFVLFFIFHNSGPVEKIVGQIRLVFVSGGGAFGPLGVSPPNENPPPLDTGFLRLTKVSLRPMESSQCRHLIPSGPQRALPGRRSVISGQNSAMLDRKRPLSSQQRDLSGAKTEPSQANVDLPKASAGPS